MRQTSSESRGRPNLESSRGSSIQKRRILNTFHEFRRVMEALDGKLQTASANDQLWLRAPTSSQNK